MPECLLTPPVIVDVVRAAAAAAVAAVSAANAETRKTKNEKKRCYTITVDLSTNVSLSCKCQPSPEKRSQRHGEEKIAHPSREEEAAEEASAIRLFTSCSEGVSIHFEGLSPSPTSPPPPPPPPSSSSSSSSPEDNKPAADAVDAADAANESAAATAVTYRVPKDWRYDKGDGPRSVSRITIDRSSSGGDSDKGNGNGNGVGGCLGGSKRCKTLRCDQYGIPLEEVEAAKEGVPWTWEHGRVGVAASQSDDRA